MELSNYCLHEKRNMCLLYWLAESICLVDWNKLKEILQKISTDWRDKGFIIIVCLGQKVKARLDHGGTNTVEMGRGKCEICCTSLIAIHYLYYISLVQSTWRMIKQGRNWRLQTTRQSHWTYQISICHDAADKRRNILPHMLDWLIITGEIMKQKSMQTSQK